MVDSPSIAGLIPLASGTLSFNACRDGAGLTAINLASVTPAAEHGALAAPGTQKHAADRFHTEPPLHRRLSASDGRWQLTGTLAKNDTSPANSGGFTPAPTGMDGELELHGEKTRLLEFGRHAATGRKGRALGKPETFTFLGFTFICGKSRGGAFLLHRKTRRDRMTAKLRKIKEELRRRMHTPIPEQGRWLRAVVQGFLAYHAVPTNFRAVSAFRYHVTTLWLRALRRRSQKTTLTWERMLKLAADWLPTARILHPWPNQRFAVKHPR
jgi:hypothetical protein